MNHSGEISALVKIAEPEVRVWTNVGPAHLEFFGTVEAIARGQSGDSRRRGQRFASGRQRRRRPRHASRVVPSQAESARSASNGPLTCGRLPSAIWVSTARRPWCGRRSEKRKFGRPFPGPRICRMSSRRRQWRSGSTSRSTTSSSRAAALKPVARRGEICAPAA